MIIVENTLIRIDSEDIIDGVFVAPDDVLYIGDNLYFYDVVKMILPNVIEIGPFFMEYNRSLKHLVIPKVERIGSYFLFNNEVINEIVMPNIKEIGFNFLVNNDSLEKLDIPNINKIYSEFLYSNTKFQYTPNIIKALYGDIYIGCKGFNKIEYFRNMKISKII